MDIIKQYYDHEILLMKEDEGWSWVLSLCVGSYPIVVSSCDYFDCPFLAEKTAIKGINSFFACYALSCFLNDSYNKNLISQEEHLSLLNSISFCDFDF